MSLSVVYTRAALGINAPLITIEVHISQGLPGLVMVGLPETTVKESRDRVRSAIINSGYTFPAKKITINLAPADLPKEGGRYDLPIAIALLAASEQLNCHKLGQYEFVGELALTGVLRGIPGALSAAIEAINAWRIMHEPPAPLGAKAEQTEPVYFDLEIRSAHLDSGHLDLPPQIVPYVLESLPYAIEHSHHAVMIRSSRKHGHLRGDALVRAMIDKGLQAGEEVRIFLFPQQRQFCIERKVPIPKTQGAARVPAFGSRVAS